MVAAIRVAADGGSMFAPSVTRRLIEEFTKRARREAPPLLEELTPHGLEVLRLIAGGLSNHEIAVKLVVSEHTAKTHVAHILQKLNLRDRVQAVVLAYETELVVPGSSGRREPGHLLSRAAGSLLCQPRGTWCLLSQRDWRFEGGFVTEASRTRTGDLLNAIEARFGRAWPARQLRTGTKRVRQLGHARARASTARPSKPPALQGKGARACPRVHARPLLVFPS